MRPTSAPMFSLRLGEPELVVPIKPTPHELKKLSDIDDQEGLRFQLPFIMFYNGNPLIKEDPVQVIREALTKALVDYYPFAGRLTEGPNCELMVDCSGEGVLFIEADADVSLMQLGDAIQPPCPCLQKLLHDVPGSETILGSPLLLIQVTRLRCGGFIFAIRMNHAFTNGHGLCKFLDAIVKFAQGAQVLSQPPVWQREILNARNPPRITCTHKEYDDNVIDINGSMQTMDITNMVYQPFFFGPMEISNIKKHLPPQLHKSSTFEVLTAYLWKCRTIALQPDPNQVVLISYTVSVSSHIKLPTGYYGNAFAFPAALSKAELVCNNPLGYALELVKKVKTQMSEEYIKSMADLLVIKGGPCYSKTWSFIVADTRRTSFGKIDFGWGKPIYGGPAGPAPNITIFSNFKNNKGEDGVSVMMSLSLQAMERFQKELMRMTQDPQNDIDCMKHQRIKSFL